MATKGHVKAIPRDTAIEMSRPILDHLKSSIFVKEHLVAGSIRREEDQVNDVDIIAVTTYDFEAKNVLDVLSQSFIIKQVISVGEVKGSFILQSGLQVDVYTCRPDELGAMLLYFTGSKQFNIALRSRANKMGYKLNQESLYKEEERVPNTDTEDAIFDTLGLKWISPWKRSIELNDWSKVTRLFKENAKE